MDINLLGLMASGTKSFVSTMITKTSPSEKILDPMSCIIRIAILSFKKDKTKIGIHNNSLEFQLPTYLQGTIRWTNGDTRTDLHYLHNPIVKAIEWYKLQDIKLILEICKEGLIKLTKSYIDVVESNLVCHSLKYYIKIIDVKLKTKEINNNRDLILFNRVENEIQNPNIYDNRGIQKLKSLWSIKEIKIINDMFKLIIEYKHKNYDIESLLQAIDIIVKGKDKIVKKLIIKLTTTLSI